MRKSTVSIFKELLSEHKLDLGTGEILDNLLTNEIISPAAFTNITAERHVGGKIRVFTVTLGDLSEEKKWNVLYEIMAVNEDLWRELDQALRQEEKTESIIQECMATESFFSVNFENLSTEAKNRRIIEDKHQPLVFVAAGRFQQPREVQKKKIKAFISMMDKLSEDKKKDLVSLLGQHNAEAGEKLEALVFQVGKESSGRTSSKEAAPGATGATGGLIAGKSIRPSEEMDESLQELVKQTENVLEDLLVDNCKVNASGYPEKYTEMTTYKNFSDPKGLALVINNEDFGFDEDKKPRKRTGTNMDAENIQKLFEKLGYEVQVVKDLTAEKMESAVEEFAGKPEHQNCDSAVVVILSHGRACEKVVGCDNKVVSIPKLVEYLQECSNLRNKPKLFFLQACRGRKRNLGQEQTDEDGTLEQEQEEVDEDDLQPTGADTLLAYSTPPGFRSIRNSTHGAWFIQAICRVFAKHATDMDILTMLTRVNAVVAEMDGYVKKKGDVEPVHVKQIPSSCNQLRKDFYFFPGYTQKKE